MLHRLLLPGAILAAILTLGPSLSAGAAEQAVNVGGAFALLNKPANIRAAAVLIPGADGNLNVREDGSFGGLAGNQLVRTRKAYANYGIATLTVDRGVDVGEAVAFMRQITPRVVVVANSRGSLRAAGALAGRPTGLVLTSAFLDDVRSAVGSPTALPATLVIHHRQDGCSSTPPAAVAPFKAWGGSKVRVVWMDGGGNAGDPCQAAGHHGFAGLDGRVVATVAAFAKSAR